MKNDLSTSRQSGAFIRPLFFLTPVVLAAMMLASPDQAGAQPFYAQKTGLHCAVCHVNPRGAGKLTDFGNKWVARGMKLVPTKFVPVKMRK